jgi:hypothetical protein
MVRVSDITAIVSGLTVAVELCDQETKVSSEAEEQLLKFTRRFKEL